MATIHTNGVFTRAPEDEIAWLVNSIRQLECEIEALEERRTDHKDRLRELLTQRGENWSDDLGYARLTKDSTRTTYDAKALEALFVADKRRYGYLAEFRKQFTVKGGVQVK